VLFRQSFSRAQLPPGGHSPFGPSILGQSFIPVNSSRYSLRFGRPWKPTATGAAAALDTVPVAAAVLATAAAALPMSGAAKEWPSICGGTVSPAAERQPASARKVGAISTFPVNQRGSVPGSTPGPRTRNGTRASNS
jgi:hypothetical protein